MTTETSNHSVYIETSVVSYLSARPARDVVAAAWRAITLDWWENQKPRFGLYTSELTFEESRRGDPVAASRRLAVLEGIPVLPIDERAVEISETVLQSRALPSTAQADALHIGISAAYGMDFLLTWNFRHPANAANRTAIRRACSRLGYTCPEICTPRELYGDEQYV